MNLGSPLEMEGVKGFSGLYNSNHLSFLVQSVSSSSQTLSCLPPDKKHLQQKPQHFCSWACLYLGGTGDFPLVTFNFWGILCFTNNIQAMQQLLV